MKRLITAGIVGFVLFFVVYNAVNADLTNDDLGVILFSLLLLVGGVIVLLVILVLDFRDYSSETGNWKSFLPTATGAFFLTMAVIFFKSNTGPPDYHYDPSLIRGYSIVSGPQALNSDKKYYLDCKTDGKYYLTETTIGNGEDEYTGTYSFKDSLIQLDKKYDLGGFNTNKFLIRTVPEVIEHVSGNYTIDSKHILLLDDNGKEMDCGFYFHDIVGY